MALFAGDTGEIKTEVRDQIDVKVSLWNCHNSIALVIFFACDCCCLSLGSRVEGRGQGDYCTRGVVHR